MMKGQGIIIFVLVGFAILLLLGISFVILKIPKTAVETEAAKVSEQAVRTSLTNYVTDCLDISSSRALKLLGEQGGHIFKSQGGITPDIAEKDLGSFFLRLKEDGGNVSYLIRLQPDLPPVGIDAAITNNVSYASPVISYYPWLTFPYKEGVFAETEKTFFAHGPFGWNKIPPQNISSRDSVQESLQNATLKGVLDCINWGVFEKQDFNVSADPASVSVVIGNASTSFILNWPVTLSKGNAKIFVNKFSSAHTVRLRKIYDYVKSIIDMDVLNASFDITKLRNIRVSRREKYGSLVEYRDTLSSFDGEQYVFRFARQNRAPALFYIPQEFIDENVLINTCIGTLFLLEGGDFIIKGPSNNPEDACGFRHRLHIRSIDPDEQDIKYSFSAVPSIPIPGGTVRLENIQIGDDLVNCIKVKVGVSDGISSDWQRIFLWVKSPYSVNYKC